MSSQNFLRVSRKPSAEHVSVDYLTNERFFLDADSWNNTRVFFIPTVSFQIKRRDFIVPSFVKDRHWNVTKIRIPIFWRGRQSWPTSTQQAIIKYKHFKIKNLQTFRYLVRKEDWLVKLDLEDAYLIVQCACLSTTLSKNLFAINWGA
jgi:hypothetical protein